MISLILLNPFLKIPRPILCLFLFLLSPTVTSNESKCRPPYGFIHKPSTLWPPPPAEDRIKIDESVIPNVLKREAQRKRRFATEPLPPHEHADAKEAKTQGSLPIWLTSSESSLPLVNEDEEVDEDGELKKHFTHEPEEMSESKAGVSETSSSTVVQQSEDSSEEGSSNKKGFQTSQPKKAATATEQPTEPPKSNSESLDVHSDRPHKKDADNDEEDEDGVVEAGPKADLGRKMWEPRRVMKIKLDGKEIELREQIQVSTSK